MLEFDASNVLQELETVRARLVSERPQLLRAWGRNILDRAHRDFDVKSRGGTGSDGIKWAPLRPATIRRNRGRTAIGVATGELGQPIGDLLQVRNNEVEAGFADPQAEFFDELRPLLPIPIPKTWHRHLEHLTQVWGEAIVRQLS